MCHSLLSSGNTLGLHMRSAYRITKQTKQGVRYKKLHMRKKSRGFASHLEVVRLITTAKISHI